MTEIDEHENRVLEILKAYTCQHTRDQDDSGMSLVDILTPPGHETIALGQEELELLADAIEGGLLDLKPIEAKGDD